MKVAFCFPGQGSLEEGMGRDVAEAFPAARDVYRIGSVATGLDLEELCFSTPLDQLVDTEVQQPALVATSLAILAAMRERGLEPDVVVGNSVGEFAALAAAGSLETGTAIGLVREREPDAHDQKPRSRRRGVSGVSAIFPPPGASWRTAAAPARRSRSSAGGSSACGRRTTTARGRSWCPGSTRRSRSAAPRPLASALDEQ